MGAPASHSPAARPLSAGLSVGVTFGGWFLLFPQGPVPEGPPSPFPPVVTPSPPEQAGVAVETQAACLWFIYT